MQTYLVTKDTNTFYGFAGVPSDIYDVYGEQLNVGDIVKIFSKTTGMLDESMVVLDVETMSYKIIGLFGQKWYMGTSGNYSLMKYIDYSQIIKGRKFDNWAEIEFKY